MTPSSSRPPMPVSLRWAAFAGVVTWREAADLAATDALDVESMPDELATAARRYIHWLATLERMQ